MRWVKAAHRSVWYAGASHLDRPDAVWRAVHAPEEEAIHRSTKALVAAVATLLVPGVTGAQTSIDTRLAPGQPPVIIAHRAVSGGAPENSLAGIAHAIETGIDMVELDVRPTRDGHYILMHDPFLLRTTNAVEMFPNGSPHRDPEHTLARQHAVADYDFTDVRELSLQGARGGDHPVPSLDEVLDLAEGRVLVILELKQWQFESLVPVLERHDPGNLLLFSQWDPSQLRKTAEATGIGVFATMERVEDVLAGLDDLLEQLGPQLKMVDVPHGRVTLDFLARAEEVGIAVAIDGMGAEDRSLTAGDPAPWLEALNSGATAFFTRQPDALLGLLAK